MIINAQWYGIYQKGDVQAGAIYRIKRKASYGSTSYDPAEYSFTTIEEVQTAISENRSPVVCYYDYFIETTLLTREQHSAAAAAKSYDDTKYDNSGWMLNFN